MNRRLSFYQTFVCLLLAIILFATCAKEYSYEGGKAAPKPSGSAIYTFEGAGGPCTGSDLSGRYFTGIALDTSHRIQLQVNVTAIGTYTISTNTVNGIQFTASGTFTNTGVQTLTLGGEGTPAATGTFTFSTPGSVCTFTVTVSKLSDTPAGFTLAGSPTTCTDAAVNGGYVNGTALTSSHTVVLKVNVAAIGAWSIRTDTLGGISFSASGVFTSTGPQTVTLTGSGTPDQPDNLVFTPRPAAGAPGCRFTVAVQNREPLATYVLESGVGNCTFTAAGSYTANTALTPSNTVSIRVFVTVLGNYTIATQAVNGMRFYRSGVFTSMGSQLVILNGSGTPTAAGNFPFVPMIVGPHPLGGESCGFFITVN